MADLPASRMDVQGVPALWLFEKVPSPASGPGILGAWKKPVKTPDAILSTDTETQASFPRMVSQQNHSINNVKFQKVSVRRKRLWKQQQVRT